MGPQCQVSQFWSLKKLCCPLFRCCMQKRRSQNTKQPRNTRSLYTGGWLHVRYALLSTTHLPAWKVTWSNQNMPNSCQKSRRWEWMLKHWYAIICYFCLCSIVVIFAPWPIKSCFDPSLWGVFIGWCAKSSTAQPAEHCTPFASTQRIIGFLVFCLLLIIPICSTFYHIEVFSTGNYHPWKLLARQL